MPINKIAYQVLEENQQNYINILRSGQSVSDIGWTTYADSAGTNPVDGIGGSPSITWSQNTSSPLSGDSDLRLVKDAVNRQGNGVSIPFTIANRHLGKVLQITCDMELISGTYASGDLRISIIQDPTGTPVVLEPVGTSLELGIANQRIREIATFQSHISITSYRLCIHVSSTSANAYTVDFANFKVWEPTQSIGSVITDWQSYTPTIVGCGTVSTVDFRWRRAGSSMEIFGSFRTGTTTAVPIQIPLPNGLFPNLPNSANQTRNSVGIGTRAEYSSTVNSYNVIADNSLNYLTFGYLNAGSSSYDPLATFNCSSVFNTNDDILVRAEVPIAGWGSSVAMSSDSGDGRVISAMVTGSLSTGANTSTNLTWSSPTILYDTHGGFNATTGYTAPVSGYYQFTGYFNTDSTSGTYWNAWVSGSNRQSCGVSLSGFIFVSGTVLLLAGQNLTFRPASGSVASVSSGNYFTINRVSTGSQVIATSETVACSVNKTSGTASASTRIASWNTKDLDTHGSFDLTNGTFTVPMSGVYLINASAHTFNFTSYNQAGFTIRSGTTVLSTSTMYFTSSFEPEIGTSALRRFIAGDIISLYGYGSGFACNNLIMNISRIGI